MDRIIPPTTSKLPSKSQPSQNGSDTHFEQPLDDLTSKHRIDRSHTEGDRKQDNNGREANEDKHRKKWLKRELTVGELIAAGIAMLLVGLTVQANLIARTANAIAIQALSASREANQIFKDAAHNPSPIKPEITVVMPQPSRGRLIDHLLPLPTQKRW
jgi:hypothetical protein